eukprot:TRINITY_DN4288_c0_g1_i5.p1 TRINITY_DN4288_c0_g1~~TRINITY_DN4288_c0_g1_i5.p1  ORF type:complete len:234 (+),score=69.16 TRINITY_DN4288_c0_g1_i5:490-1191(+)
MRKAIREEIKHGSDWIKLLVTGAFMTANDDPNLVHFSPSELETAKEECQRLKRPIMAHAHSAEGIKAAIRGGARSIEHGSFIDDEGIQMMLDAGLYLVPTIYIGEYYLERPEAKVDKMNDIHLKTKETYFNCIRRAHQRGVKMVLGTDYVGWPVENNFKEMIWMHNILKMTPMQVIKSATSVSAEMLQWEIGSIEKGKLADIIAVEGDPSVDLSKIENIKFVMIGGKVVRQSK